MVEVPNFRKDGPILAAAEVWDGTSLSLERTLNLAQGVRSLVRGNDSRTELAHQRYVLQGQLKDTHAASISKVGYILNARITASKKSITS